VCFVLVFVLNAVLIIKIHFVVKALSFFIIRNCLESRVKDKGVSRAFNIILLSLLLSQLY